MDCRRTKKLLSEYLDGVLSPEDAGRVESHLASCAACAETLADLQRLVGYMREMETVEEPADLLGNVKAGIERTPSPAEWLRRLFYPPMVKLPAAAAVVVLVAMLAVFGPRIGRGPELPGLSEAPIQLVSTAEVADVYELTLTVSGPVEGAEKGRRFEGRAGEVGEVDMARAEEISDVVAGKRAAQPGAAPTAPAREKKGQSRDVSEQRALRTTGRDAPAPATADALKTEAELPAAEKVDAEETVGVQEVLSAAPASPPDTMVVEIAADSLAQYLAALAKSGWTVGEVPPEAYAHKGLLRITVVYLRPAPADTAAVDPPKP